MPGIRPGASQPADPPTSRYDRSVNDSKVISDLRQAMLDRGLTQRDLAERMRVNQSWLSRVFSNRRSVTLKTAIRVAEALDCEIIVVPKDGGAGMREPEVPAPGGLWGERAH